MKAKNAHARPVPKSDDITLTLISEHGNRYSFRLPRALAIILKVELTIALEGTDISADT